MKDRIKNSGLSTRKSTPRVMCSHYTANSWCRL